MTTKKPEPAPNPTPAQCTCRPKREIVKGAEYVFHADYCRLPREQHTQVYR